MNFKTLFPYLCLALVLISHLVFGLDLTHHSHNAWLYNSMILEGRFLLQDPYLLNGQQLTFVYGIIVYPIAGLLWFIFNYYTVEVLMLLITLIDFILLRKMLKNNVWVGFLLLSLILHTIGDTLVAHFSIMLFWLGTLLYYKKKRIWQIPIILSCINHPIMIVPSIFYMIKDKKMIPILSIIFLYFAGLSAFFAQSSSLTYYLPFIFLFRVLISLGPIFVLEDSFKKYNHKLFNWVRDFLSYKVTIYQVILISMAIILIVQNSVITIGLQVGTFLLTHSLTQVRQDFFEDFPDINGTLRIVDYHWLPSVVLNNENIVSTEGSFRENNNIKLEFQRFYWTNDSYAEFVNENNFDYIMICKKCTPPTNENEFLELYYNLFWENEYYSIYSI